MQFPFPWIFYIRFITVEKLVV